MDEAKTPRPHKPNLQLNALLALVLGLLGGVGLAFLFERLDDTFKRPEELEKLLGLPVLGVIPMTRQNRSDGRPWRWPVMTTSVWPSPRPTDRCVLPCNSRPPAAFPRLLTITSAMSGEGKSTTVLSLAIQFAQTGKRTSLIDVDLRKPSLHRSLSLDNQVGLTNYLAGGGAQPVDIAKPTHIPNLFAIPSGPRFHPTLPSCCRRHGWLNC